MPMATRRSRSSRNMLEMSESVDGAKVAPAMPSRARVAIRASAVVDSAAATEAAANAAAPMSSNRLRPSLSPSVPMVIKRPATMKP